MLNWLVKNNRNFVTAHVKQDQHDRTLRIMQYISVLSVWLLFLCYSMYYPPFCVVSSSSFLCFLYGICLFLCLCLLFGRPVPCLSPCAVGQSRAADRRPTTHQPQPHSPITQPVRIPFEQIHCPNLPPLPSPSSCRVVRRNPHRSPPPPAAPPHRQRAAAMERIRKQTTTGTNKAKIHTTKIQAQQTTTNT